MLRNSYRFLCIYDKKLPPIRLSGYPAIIFGKESEQAQEKRNEKSEADLPKKVYPAIRVFEYYNPRLNATNKAHTVTCLCLFMVIRAFYAYQRVL